MGDLSFPTQVDFLTGVKAGVGDEASKLPAGSQVHVVSAVAREDVSNVIEKLAEGISAGGPKVLRETAGRRVVWLSERASGPASG